MTTSSDQPELSQALTAVRQQLSDFGAWDALEAEAERLEAPEIVAELYLEALSAELSPAVLRRLGERALRFGEAWFGDDAPQMQALLVRVFELEPSDEAIFERVVVSLTTAERWALLLEVHEHAIAASGDLERRAELLAEAVRLADDLLHDEARALTLLRNLVFLRPDEPAIRGQFERLLERAGQYHELVLSLSRRVEARGPARERSDVEARGPARERSDVEARGPARERSDVLARRTPELEARIGSLWLRELASAPRALEVADRLLADDPSQPDALGLAEEIVASEHAPTATRRAALALLSEMYGRLERPLDKVRVLRTGATLYEGSERERLHREAARLLRELDRPADVLMELGEAFVRAPGDAQLLQELEGEAERGELGAALADILERASAAAGPAQRYPLLLRAAVLREHKLGEQARAVELYRAVLAQDELREAALEAGRALDAIFDRTGDGSARMGVLARLSELEALPEARRELRVALGQVALELGDRERALAVLRERLDDDPSDREALDDLVALHAQSGDREAFMAALERRASAAEGPAAARDFARIAELAAEKPCDLDAVLKALTRLHAVAPELGEELGVARLLERAAERATTDNARLSGALADAYHSLVGDAEHALAHYARALAAEPQLEAARTGLQALLADERVRARAADVLAGAFASCDDVDGLLELLPHRLATAPSSAERARLLRQAAQLEGWRRGSPPRAFAHMCQALVEEPSDVAGDLELWRVAEQLEAWGELAAALRRAADRLEPGHPRYAQLRRQEGELCELRLADLPRAFEAYRAAVKAMPGEPSLAEAACRSAALLGRYPEAFEAVVTLADRLDQMPDELLGMLEQHAAESGAFAELSATARATLEHARLSAPVRRWLLLRLAEWYERRVGDLDGAEAVLLDASKLGGPHAEILHRLAALQRRAPGRALFDTLVAAGGLHDRGLAELSEAAEVARTTLADSALERSVLERLVARGAKLLRSGQRDSDVSAPEEVLCEAVTRLADRLAEAGDTQAELALLREAADFPLAPRVARGFAERAAKLALGRLGDAELGIALYQRALELEPDDPELLAALGAEYDRTGRLEELVALRRRELAASSGVGRRLELRLELARVLGLLEARGGRLGTLRENLREAPGHAESLAQAEQILRTQGALGGLYELLSEQAAQLDAIGEAQRAASLWRRAARLAEHELHEEEHALIAYQSLARLEHDEPALEALARIRLARGEPALALPWLERILEERVPAARVSIRLRLASAYQGAGDVDAAIRTLERGVEEAPGAFELRDLLAELYARKERFEPLADLLAESAARASEDALRLAYARRAAALFARELGRPERSAEVLEGAMVAYPDDRALKLDYADALIAAGRFEDAKVLLEAQVHEYGRRRSPERAELHLRLSRVAKAAGQIEEALSQLDQAASMDRSHPASLRALGELAIEAGQLERAERAYRALLLVVRKPPPGVEPELGAAEVLYQLQRIALELGQADKAAELLEQAVQTAAQSEQETERLKALLLERGEPALLLRVLELRLSQVSSAVTEAEVLSDLADVLESALERKDEALAARLKALACAPELDGLHAATLRVAKQLGAEQSYLDTLLTLIERARRKHDQALVSDLALRAGSVAEHVLGNLEVAEAGYRQVASGAPGFLEAQFALARVAGKLGHHDEERAALERIAEQPDGSEEGEGKREARYRLIELRVQDPATRQEGLLALGRLLAEQPEYARASRILRAAHEGDPGDREVLALLEQMARQSGDPELLLDAIERHAEVDDAELALVREGAELAQRLEVEARAGGRERSDVEARAGGRERNDYDTRLERLLRRAIAIAQSREAFEEAAWAPTLLARVLQRRGDLEGALTWFEQALTVDDQASLFELGLELAARAAEQPDQRARAMRVYELLRERAPFERRVWAPLLAFYKAEGELDRMLDVVRTTLETLPMKSDRNALRLETARLLFEAGREDQGAGLLEEALAEDPDQADAALHLADLYERRGERGALVELLSHKFESARERRSPSIIPLSLRMGALLENERPEQATDVYRRALAVVPDSEALLRAAIEHLDPGERGEERAALIVRYLSANDAGSRAQALPYASWLVDYRAEQLEPAAFEHALELAHRVAPEDAGLRERLIGWHRERGHQQRLAELLEAETRRERDADRAIALLTEAAELRLALGQASEAAALLRQARELTPDDFELLRRAVHASAASGELGPALAEIDRALERADDGARVELLLLRADIAGRAHMYEEALVALLEAHQLAGDPASERLAQGIEQARAAARARADVARERELTLSLASLERQRGGLDRAIAILDQWRSRVRGDVEVLRVQLELTTLAQRWTDVVEIAEALCDEDEPDVLSQVCERLVEASRALGTPALARPALERALSRDPSQPRLAELLEALYAEIGDKRALAGLLASRMDPRADAETRFEQLRRVGQLLVEAGDIDQAMGYLQEALEHRPDDLATVIALVDAHITAGRAVEAREMLERSMGALRSKRSPELAQLRHRMSRLLGAAGDEQGRYEWLNYALDADMNNGEVASELAVVAQEQGQLETALKALRAITMMKGEVPMSRAEAFYRQAVIVAHKGETRRAVLWAKKAKAEDQHFPGVDRLIAELESA